MEKIIIVAACDDKYSSHAGALAASVFANNQDVVVEFNLLTDFMSEENQQKFLQLATTFKQVVKIIHVDKSRFENLPIGQAFEDHINISTYFRLLIPDVFCSEDKILYLDSDMIVRKSLLPLWNSEIRNYAFLGVRDIEEMQQTNPLRLNYPIEDSYFNAGMGLYNLDYLKQLGFNEIVSEFIANHSNLIICHDQDILNACFHGKFKPVSETWNMLNDFLTYRYQYYGEDKTSFEAAKKDCCIVHFTTAIKPWHKECQNPYKSDYWKYLKMTPWKDEKPVFFFSNIYQRYMYLSKWRIKKIISKIGFKRGYIKR